MRKSAVQNRVGNESNCDSEGGAVRVVEDLSLESHVVPAFSTQPWYAVQTRSRCEHQVANHLRTRGINQYLPTITETHVWSDRRKKVELPLFSGYVFVRIDSCNERRVDVLRVPGVVRLVGSSPVGTPIPSEQIEAIRSLVQRNLPLGPYPFLTAGQRVRVRGGALDGLEGIFVKHNGLDTLVISVAAIQRSLSVSIQGYGLEPS